MKHAQVTLFMILGIVIVLSIVAVIFIAQASIVDTQPEVQEYNLSAQQCLTDAVREATSLLAQQGHILNQRPYIVASDFRLGSPQYTGLCAQEGNNGIQGGLTPSCEPSTYHYGTGSIQEQMTIFVNQSMNDCGLDEGEADVFIQRDALQVRYSNPEVQYSESIPLTSVWAAIREFVNNETLFFEYQPETIKACDACAEVTVQRIDNPAGADQYSFTVGPDILATITVEDRLPIIFDENGIVGIAADNPAEDGDTFIDPDGNTEFTDVSCPSFTGSDEDTYIVGGCSNE